MKILLSLIILISILNENISFENTIWRGTTLHYQLDTNKKINLLNPIITYNISKITDEEYDKNNLKLRFKSYDKLGGIFTTIPKIHNWMIDDYNMYIKNIINSQLNLKKIENNNEKSYKTKINYFHETTRSIIIFEYSYDIQKKLEINSIKISQLRCGGIKQYKTQLRLTNISSFLNLIKNWNFCKTTNINPSYPYSYEIIYSNSFDYKFLLTNEARLNHIFNGNLIISLPNIIEEYKPFTFLIGNLISKNNYNQLNINYNYKGELMSVEYNEYEPSRLISK